MNEKAPSTAGGTPLAGATQPAVKSAAVSPAVAPVPVAAAPVVQSVATPAQPPSAFGGRKGGAKSRADGLVPGSEAAKKVDAANDALRQFITRNQKNPSANFHAEFQKRLAEILPVHREKFIASAKAVATLPPALPGAKVPAVPVANAAPGVSPVDAAVANVPGVSAPVVPVTFVAWSAKMLERPIKTLTKIIDRFRVGKLMERVRKLGLGKDLEAEAEKKMAYKEAQVNDFNAALTNVAVIELNKLMVPGAEHSHWLELAMTGGELVNCHMDMVDWLEKQILAKAEREKAAIAEKN